MGRVILIIFDLLVLFVKVDDRQGNEATIRNEKARIREQRVVREKRIDDNQFN
jgi:hypothetical protein